MSLRYYSNTASQAALASAIGATDTSITFTAGTFSGYPTQFPYTAALARGTANEEIVLVTAASGSTVTVTRAYDGTTAKAQGAGTTFTEVVVAKDYREANDHVNATAGVHGRTGNLVGDTDAQTLTNKTLTNPTVTDGTFTGTQTVAAETVTTLTVTGVTTVAALTASGLVTANGGITVPTGKKVTLTDAPAATTDAANKAYVDGQVSPKAPLASPTFTGTVTIPTLRLTSGGDASLTSTTHAFQVGDSASLNLIMDNNEIITRNNGVASALVLTGCSSVSVPTPTANGHAATKGYVDGVTQAIASGTAAQAGAVPSGGAPVLLRASSVVFTPDSGGQATVSFDSAFPHAVLAVTLSPGSTGQNMAMIELVSVTTSSITVLCRNYTGAVIAAGSVRLDYIALGC